MRWQQALVLGCPSLGCLRGVYRHRGARVLHPSPGPAGREHVKHQLEPSTGHCRCPGETGPRARTATHGALRYLPSLTQPLCPGPCTQCPIRGVYDQRWCPRDTVADTPGVTPGQSTACATVPGWPEQTCPSCMVPDTPAGSCSWAAQLGLHQLEAGAGTVLSLA